MNSELIEKTANYVKRVLKNQESGHDWWHIKRVWNNAKSIMKKEGGNTLVVELAALLHDIADHKFHDGDKTLGPKVAKEWLESINTDLEVIEHVVQIISEVSFTSGKKPTTHESAIVQDADRLDALGAIGIARAFSYSGKKGRVFYDPESKEGSSNSTIDHFYEKVLLLRDLMNTETAREIASGRHNYLVNYIEQFYDEWEGKS